MSRRNERGFTLAEMLVSVGLIGILVAMSTGALDAARRRLKLRSAAQEIAVTLVAARSEATLENASVTVAFEPDSGRYALTSSAPPGTRTLALVRPAAGLPPGLRFRCPDSTTPVTLVPPGTNDRAARFDSRGRLSSSTSPGHVCLTDTAGSSYRRVQVDTSGRVRIQVWSGSAWR